MATSSRITSMPEADTAYQAALAALHKAHSALDVVINSSPVNWTAYKQGLATCTSCQNAAQAAEDVFGTAILDTPAVETLIHALTSNTQEMTQSAAELDKTAEEFKKLAKAADTLSSVLGNILKFI